MIERFVDRFLFAVGAGLVGYELGWGWQGVVGLAWIGMGLIGGERESR